MMSEKPSWTKWAPAAVPSTARARFFTSSRIPQGRTVHADQHHPRLHAHGRHRGDGAGRGQARAEGLAAHRRVRHARRAERGRRARPRLQRRASREERATPPEAAYEGMFRVGEREVRELEELMDRCQKDLTPLKSFILPGGGRIHGFLHQARTVCRRAEREVLALSRVEPIGAWPLQYLNRLSDAFFVLGRWVGKHLGEHEYLWERGLASHARARRKGRS